jgi:hypothetical protein
MTATYLPTNIDPANAAGDIVSAVRWLIQDTDTALAEVQDEEVQALAMAQDAEVSQTLVVYRVAVQLATAMWRKYSKQASFSSGGTQVALKDRAESWKGVLDQLQGLAAAVEAQDSGSASMVVYGSRDRTVLDWGYWEGPDAWRL